MNREDYDEEFLKALGEEVIDDSAEVKIDPSKIDFSDFNPYEITDLDEAMIILQYLKKNDRGRAENWVYAALVQEFELEEVTDPWRNLTPEMKILIASDFLKFVQYAFMCEYGFKFRLNWHHVYMARVLEAVYHGKLKCPNLIINIPPRYSKTQMSIYFIAWTQGLAPDAHSIMVTYSGELSEANCGQVLEAIDSEWYRQIFNVIIDPNYRKRKDWKTTKGGRVFSTSTGGRLTGVGAGKMRSSWGGAIYIDDPHKAEDIKSTVKMNAATGWFSNTCLSRRNGGEDGYVPIIIIMQRLSEEDLTFYCLPSEEHEDGQAGENFVHFNIPAMMSLDDMERLQEEMSKIDETFDIYNTPTYRHGDIDEDEYPLWYAKYNLKSLRKMKKSLPPLTWYGQYQQVPFVSDGLYFKEEWFDIVQSIDYSQVKTRVFVLDTALTEKKSSDWSVILVACVMRNGTVVAEDIIRGKWTSPKLLEQLSIAYQRYGPTKVYIEYKTSGITLCQLIKNGNDQGTVPPMPVKKIPRDGVTGNDKVTRAENTAPFMENKSVKLLKADWNSKLLHEALGFPTAKHDDILDAVMDLVEREVAIHGLADMDYSQVESELEKPRQEETKVSAKSKDWRDFYNQAEKFFEEEKASVGWASLIP
jgi:predicted phage terminase large subunit-like protein